MDDFKNEINNNIENIEENSQPAEQASDFGETQTDFNNETFEEPSVESDESKSENETAESNFTPFSNNTPPAAKWEPINYTPCMPYEKKAKASKGLKVFAFIVAAAILVSSACLGGYFLGLDSNSGHSYKKVEVDLDSKPKDTDEYTVAKVYDILNPSIVGIRVYNANGNMADASGVIYSKDGYLITNDHIYSGIGAPKFKVYTYDGKEYNAEYIAGDSISDLAVLKIKGNDFTAAAFGNSSEIVCGERVTAIGRPSDATADSSISQGCISAVSRRMTTTSNYSVNLIQTDSAINPGSSGGALVNMYGQVVGITASKIAGDEYDAIGFAIPTVTVKRVAEQLIKNGKVTDRAKLGISYTEVNSVTAELGKYATTGLYVASVTEDSDLYGKLNEGDIITHINGKRITKDDIVLDIIDNSYAGDKITVTVQTSKGATKEYTAVLKANIGDSSYNEKLNSSNNSSDSDSTFNFPYGE